jgi:rhodanese-related sulfurtransferase
MTSPIALAPVTPGEAKVLVEAGRAILIDIREPAEHAQERIAGARLVPLSQFAAAGTVTRAGGPMAIFHCQSGMRTTTHAARLAAACRGPACVLAGGLIAWKRAGYPTDG